MHMKIGALPLLFVLVAELVLGEAGAAAAAIPAVTLDQPPKCAKIPGIYFQAAATSMLALCPEPKEGSCSDDCVAALTTVSGLHRFVGSGFAMRIVHPDSASRRPHPMPSPTQDPNNEPHIRLQQPLFCSSTMNAPWQSQWLMPMPSWRMQRWRWMPCEPRAGAARPAWIAGCELWRLE